LETGWHIPRRQVAPNPVLSPGFKQACLLGLRYEQHAIAFVNGDMLGGRLCDHRRTLKPLTRFLEQVNPLS
jgi:hypothetical protein